MEIQDQFYCIEFSRVNVRTRLHLIAVTCKVSMTLNAEFQILLNMIVPLLISLHFYTIGTLKTWLYFLEKGWEGKFSLLS